MTWFDVVFESQFNSFLFTYSFSINRLHIIYLCSLLNYLKFIAYYISKRYINMHIFISFTCIYLCKCFTLYFSIIIFIINFLWHFNISSCTKHICYIWKSAFHGWLLSNLFPYSFGIIFTFLPIPLQICLIFKTSVC